MKWTDVILEQCFLSDPCAHRVHMPDGRPVLVSGLDIYLICKKNGEFDKANNEFREHFSLYGKEEWLSRWRTLEEQNKKSNKKCHLL